MYGGDGIFRILRLCIIRKPYEHRKQGNELSYLPDICINLADGNVHKSDYTDAAYYYRCALFLCDSLGLPDRNKFPIYYGLGQTYMELRDFDLSNHYYEMAYRYFSQMSVPEKFTYLNNRGNHFYYKKDYREGFLLHGACFSCCSSLFSDDL